MHLPSANPAFSKISDTAAAPRSETEPRRVAVAMSGGVDSSVAAALLVEQGHEVVGVHMKLHDLPDEQKRARSCCSLDDALDARQVCARLGIPFYVVDYIDAFQHRVIDYFVESYRIGQTPNPCVMCNQTVKQTLLMDQVREFGCTHLATGHYARVRQDAATGRHLLLRPHDRHKDQTYFLYGTPREELPYLMYPLAGLDKPSARKIAERHGFFTWNKPDSQEVCFVPKDYREFLAPRLSEATAPPGEFVDRAGTVLGTHNGLAYYTVGQRRGLGLGGGKVWYVVALDTQHNRVVLGPETALFGQQLTARDVNWVSIDPISAPIQAEVKIRYAHEAAPARIIPTENGAVDGTGTVRVLFDAPVRAITPGQAAVFYSGDVVLGGGTIESADA